MLRRIINLLTLGLNTAELISIARWHFYKLVSLRAIITSVVCFTYCSFPGHTVSEFLLLPIHCSPFNWLWLPLSSPVGLHTTRVLDQIVSGLGFVITADLNHFSSENHCRDCSNILLTVASYVQLSTTSILGPGRDSKLLRSLGQCRVGFP